MTTSTPGLPLSDTEKFDGTNFFTFEQTITITARIQGARGYLDGTIAKPSAPSSRTTTKTALLPPEPTAWPSTSPSLAEWNTRNAWTMALIAQNIKNPVGLGIELGGTAAEAWKSLTDVYKVTSHLDPQRELRDITLSEGGDVLAHIANLCAKWINANAISGGAKILGMDFRMIILLSLPPSWDSLLATLYESKSSSDVITRITMHRNRLNHNPTVMNPNAATNIAPVPANAGRNRRPSPLVCSNPNCKRRGHSITDCYWTGGGKEGQFPPGFGKRGGTTESSLTRTTTPTTATIASITSVDHAYALTAHISPEPPTPHVVADSTLLLTKETTLEVEKEDGNVMSIWPIGGEELLASVECIISSFPSDAWDMPSGGVVEHDPDGNGTASASLAG